ncbi:probable serine/threonine-protein kinase DDB_G0280133 isoform X2 [Punica granatum]|uniref:Probable serine/threonine-protein kinase DDB_G0280133 isoform X2 n=1 Tax=Punica granatum TaxID=22663 RepID=A0A6P8E1N7_PUNGR|nr:probable serine/threonine-protein kinase DDB_G0280133 isoform X2 [Punica granatum]
MEKEAKNQRAKEPDFVLQWGNRKRHRCVKVKSKDPSIAPTSANNNNNNNNNHSNLSTSKFSSDSMTRKRLNSSVLNPKKDSFSQSPHRGLTRSSDPPANKRKPSQHSPEKEDRFYTTRGSVGADENGKLLLDHNAKNDKGAVVWPKLFLSLSSKEKEEDFMAFKGCKPPQRPKKRAKLIQRSVLLVCPGTWLSDLSHERYEVREKKASKKPISGNE